MVRRQDHAVMRRAVGGRDNRRAGVIENQWASDSSDGEGGGREEASLLASLVPHVPKVGEKRKRSEVGAMDAGHSRSVVEQMLHDGLEADITFETDGRHDQTPAHRCILASVSPVFRAMFQNCMLERKTSQVCVEDMSTSSLRAFLYLLYTGTLAHDDDIEKFGLEVLTACHKYEVPQLGKICSTILGDKLTVENAILMLEHAALYDEPLFKRCKSFIAYHIEQIVMKPEYKDLAMREPALVVDLVRSIHLNHHVKEINVSFRTFSRTFSGRTLNSIRIRMFVDSSVADLIADLKGRMDLPSTRWLQICGISDHRIVRIYSPEDKVSEMEAEVKAEEMLPQKVPSKVRILHLAHMLADRKDKFLSYFGEPFTISIPNTKYTLGQLKEQIYTTGSDDNFGNFDFRFAKRKSLKPDAPGLVYLCDASPLPWVSEQEFLGIVHPICTCTCDPQEHSRYFHLS